MDNVSVEWLKYISMELIKFLNSNLPEIEKNKIITNCTYIYYPAINKKPVEWLYDVVSKMQEKLERSENWSESKK